MQRQQPGQIQQGGRGWSGPIHGGPNRGWDSAAAGTNLYNTWTWPPMRGVGVLGKHKAKKKAGPEFSKNAPRRFNGSAEKGCADALLRGAGHRDGSSSWSA